jgi:peptidoglycan/LPS O-acetylase OafA/YrhL
MLTSSQIKNTLNKKSLVFLGKISYSLYLVHFLVLLITSPLLFKLLSKIIIFNLIFTQISILLIVVLISVFFEFLLNKFVEQPFYKLSYKLLHSK